MAEPEESGPKKVMFEIDDPDLFAKFKAACSIRNVSMKIAISKLMDDFALDTFMNPQFKEKVEGSDL